jgi:hypothetical protein
VSLRGFVHEIRAHRGLLFLALLVGSSVLYVACGGSEHTFQEGGEDTNAPSEDGTTKDVVVDDSPVSNG